MLAGDGAVRVRADGESAPEVLRDYLRGVALLQRRAGEDPPWERIAGWYRRSREIYAGRPAVLPWQRWLLILLERELRRALGDSHFALPYVRRSGQRAAAAAALAQTVYDAPPWDSSATGLRNRLEPLIPDFSGTGAEFFLDLCNVDRLWAAWQAANPTRPYQPPQSTSPDLHPQRRNDRIESPLTAFAPTNGQMLNVSRLYVYDRLDP